jgi:hypothetical protein
MEENMAKTRNKKLTEFEEIIDRLDELHLSVQTLMDSHMNLITVTAGLNDKFNYLIERIEDNLHRSIH